MLKKIGLRKYLLLIISLIIIISCVSAIFTIYSTQKNLNELMANSEKSAAISNNIIALSIDLSSIHSSLTSLMTEKDPDVLEVSIAKLQKDFKEIEGHIQRCKFDCKQTEVLTKDYQVKVNDLVDKRILLGKTSEAIEFFIQDVSPVYFKVLTELDSKGDLIKKSTDETLSLSEKRAVELKWMIILSSVFMIVLISVAGFNFRKSLVETLLQIADRLQSSTQTLADTSREVASTSDFLSQSSTEQNATIQGTSQAVQEISSMTDVNRENVTASALNAKESLAKISEGKEAISIMLETIQKISVSNEKMIEQVNKNSTEFGEVTRLIKDIDVKTKVINDIVFQTKLLSFNASVEAARAGEHGKGFAVVAEEIGNLAIMSGQAANEISDLLNNSVKRVNEIVNNSQGQMVSIMESGKSTIEDGHSAVNNCHRIFDQISVDSQGISNMLEEINSGTIEQSKGIEEVNKSMLQINDVANKTAQIAQDSLKMAEKLNNQSESIASVNIELTTMLNGRNS